MRVHRNVSQGFNLGWKEFSGLRGWWGSHFGEDYSDLKGEVCNLYYTTFYGFSLCYKAMTLIEIPLSIGIHWHFFPAGCWVLELNKIFIFKHIWTYLNSFRSDIFAMCFDAVFIESKSLGQRSLVGYNPWGRRVRHDWVCVRVRAHTHTHTQSYLHRKTLKCILFWWCWLFEIYLL